MRALVVAFTILTNLLSISCGPQFGKIDGKPILKKMPKDHATPEERSKINETLNQISEIAKQYGYDNKFNSIPIVVLTEDPSRKGRIGYCTWHHNQRYIALNRVIFQIDKSRGPNSRQVFSTILHEIGHCYFDREHTTEVITRQGHFLLATEKTPHSYYQVSSNGFPTSVMYSDGSDRSNARIMTNIPAFQEYWVAEILGKTKVRSAEDLGRFSNLKWVPESEATRGLVYSEFRPAKN